MIWATFSSQSYFCWLYGVFPSLPAKNKINLISVLTIWWRPRVELEDGVCYDECILLAKLCKPLYSKAKFACFLTSYICIPVSYNEKDIFLGVLVLEGLVGLHRTIQLQLLQHYWLGHRLRFSSVQSLSRVQLFAIPWIAECQASLSITKSIHV